MAVLVAALGVTASDGVAGISVAEAAASLETYPVLSAAPPPGPDPTPEVESVTPSQLELALEDNFRSRKHVDSGRWLQFRGGIQ